MTWLMLPVHLPHGLGSSCTSGKFWFAQGWCAAGGWGCHPGYGRSYVDTDLCFSLSLGPGWKRWRTATEIIELS